MTKFFQYILLCVVSLCSLIACDKDDVALIPESSYTPEHSGVEGEVRIVLTDGATRASFEGMTRAILDENNNFYWQSGDKFTLIAKNSAGADAFTPCNFTCWVNTATEGRSYFRGTPDQKMTEGLYSYYAVYPGNGVSLQGNNASFHLPAVQDGTYNDELDFMVARENRAAGTTNNALVACDGNPNSEDPMNDVGFTFYHQFHALRFEIPNTGALSSGIRRVHILFPTAAAGDITVDMASFNSSTKRFNTSYSNTANKITVDFGEGNEKQAGETFWVMVLPQESYSRAVDIRFEDSQGNYTTRQLVTFPSSQQYTAGRLTPIRMNVPSSFTGVSKLHCKVDHTQLGERVNNLHLTLPDGYYFTDYTKYCNSALNSSGEFVYSIFNDMFDSTLRNADLKLDYDSTNAFIPTTVKLENSVNVGGRTDYALTAPYLFFENFDNVESFSNHDAQVTSNTGSHSYIFENLKGWTGGRIGGLAGKSVRLACRRETSARYDARLDSPEMSYIKDGASVKVKVSYNYGMDRDGNGIGTAKVGQTCYEGRTTDLSALKSGDDTGTFESSLTIDKNDNDGNGDYNNVPYSRSFVFAGCTKGTRISWRTRSEHDAGLNNTTCWLYIDNVRVSIEQ